MPFGYQTPTFIHVIKSTHLGFHHAKGFSDCSTYKRDSLWFTITAVFGPPCILTTSQPHEPRLRDHRRNQSEILATLVKNWYGRPDLMKTYCLIHSFHHWLPLWFLWLSDLTQDNECYLPCPTLQGSQSADGGARMKRLIVLYLMTALPPYLDKRKDVILGQFQKYYNLPRFGGNAELNQDWRSKWWLWLVCAWKAAKIGNFLAFLQVKIMSIRSIANRTSRT